MDEPRISLEELTSLYRASRSTFLQLHRIAIRYGIVSDKERIEIYELTRKPK